MPFQSDHTLQLARKTLENAGILLYSFASCPENFVEHKKAYIELLKFLQANERQGNTELTGDPTLFTFHGHRTDLLLDISTSRADSDPTHATNLKFHCSREKQLSAYTF